MELTHYLATILVAVFGLGFIATHNAPERPCPAGKAPPLVAVICKDEAAEELEKIHRLNKLQPKKHKKY